MLLYFLCHTNESKVECWKNYPIILKVHLMFGFDVILCLNLCTHWSSNTVYIIVFHHINNENTTEMQNGNFTSAWYTTAIHYWIILELWTSVKHWIYPCIYLSQLILNYTIYTIKWNQPVYMAYDIMHSTNL